MASKKTYTAQTAEGTTVQRKSARPYTHVLIGRKNFVAERAQAKSADQVKFHAANFNYYVSVAAGNHSSPYDSPEVKATKIAQAQEAINGHDAVSYAAAKVADYIARVCPEGRDASAEMALRWSSSAALAHKAVGEFDKWYTGLRVAEVSVK
jgi:hypothetical protein